MEQTSRPASSGSQKAPAPAPKHPPGDRSHIPPSAQPIYEILNAEMQRVKSKAPAQFKPQVLDAEKRLNILFDHLNNEDLLKPDTIEEMNELARAIRSRSHEEAQSLFTDIMTNRTDEGSNWMVRSLVLVLLDLIYLHKCCREVGKCRHKNEEANVNAGGCEEAHSNEQSYADVKVTYRVYRDKVDVVEGRKGFDELVGILSRLPSQ